MTTLLPCPQDFQEFLANVLEEVQQQKLDFPKLAQACANHLVQACFQESLPDRYQLFEVKGLGVDQYGACLDTRTLFVGQLDGVWAIGSEPVEAWETYLVNHFDQWLQGPYKVPGMVRVDIVAESMEYPQEHPYKSVLPASLETEITRRVRSFVAEWEALAMERETRVAPAIPRTRI